MEQGNIRSYKDLIVWQKGVKLVGEVYALTTGFPREEQFGLTNQIRRASVSIPANIAEGWGRDSTKNYIQFLRMARGSLFELETLFVIANDLELIDSKGKMSVSSRIEEIGKMLNKLIVKLDTVN
ncbi:MAG TPA: four helix bundle protein [Bacteroidales bacterium]|nr:four helix bundle protein [Bacteroidales bacterium]